VKITILLKNTDGLPILPRTAARLLMQLNRKRVDLQEINYLTARDPALAALVLRLANGQSRESWGTISCLAEALVMVDGESLKEAVNNNLDTIPLTHGANFNLSIFGQHCVDTANFARGLAGMLHLPAQIAYVCGLLVAMGEVPMHQHMAEDMLFIGRRTSIFDMRRMQIEHQLLGYHCAEISAELARSWHFSTAIVSAMSTMTAPFSQQNGDIDLPAILHLANWRARAKALNMDMRQLAATFPNDVAIVFGLDLDMVLQQDPIDWGSPGMARK
jgi:HD-like signal output (HDOD) protein